jgi:hypothetical protein
MNHEQLPIEGNIKTPESVTRKSDSLRKEFEVFSIGKIPLEQWSDDERNAFHRKCVNDFNNFFENISDILEGRVREGDDIPVKVQEGVWADKMLKEGQFSEKYYNSSRIQFLSDIEKTMINNNVDFDDLRQTLKRWGDVRKVLAKVSDEEFNKNYRPEYNYVIEHFHLILLPTIFELIDSGYILAELRP